MGPAVVIESIGPVLYQVQGKREPQVLHHNQLKPYSQPDVPLWVSRFQSTLGLDRASAPTRPMEMPAGTQENQHCSAIECMETAGGQGGTELPNACQSLGEPEASVGSGGQVT